MSSYKDITSEDIKATRSVLNQLIDVVALDVSSSIESSTRKKYQVFVTGGIGAGVTSSLFQTVFDQDHSLQTANPMFDMTFGLFSGSNTVANSSTGVDVNGKLLFNSKSCMMREKVNIYRQYAQNLLGSADSQFSAPFGSSTAGDKIDEALFISFKRLFGRDAIKRETFAMKFFQTGVMSHTENQTHPRRPNINLTSTSGSVIYTDVGSSTNIERSQTGGDVGNIVDASNTNRKVGTIFYQQGTIVLDLAKCISGSQHVTGAIKGMRAGTTDGNVPAGFVTIGRFAEGAAKNSENYNAKFIPDLVVSASIDDIVDHIASCRMSSGSTVAMTFQNETQINSTLIFCRMGPDEFNHSSNPTYTDSSGKVVVIDPGQALTQKPFTMITTVGLYNEADTLLAVAKLSRPIEKNEEKDVTLRVRLDF
ncbi:MAG TPA: hypothetical protein DF712_07475 [Balneola sp.]|nr:hypothetical protein [Balneola sp.]